MKNSRRYDIVIAGAGVSGLLMARKLLADGYEGSILLIDLRDKEEIMDDGDDIPYYFNKTFDLKEISFQPKRMIFQIWDKALFHERASKEMSDRYSQKIVKQKCNTTIEHINGEKEIFVPVIPVLKGRRNFLLRMLYEFLRDKLVIQFSTKIVSITMDKKFIVTSTDEFIAYGSLISTISFPVFSKIAGFEMGLKLQLEQIPFYTAILEYPVEEYRAIYIPDLSVRFNRFAFIGNRLFIEAPDQFSLSELISNEHQLIADLGCNWILNADAPITYKQINPGRLVGIDKELSEKLQSTLRSYDIYTLGRFGTWTFKLTEDIWTDADTIVKSIIK